MDRFNLGSHSRIISTGSPEAQRWFNLGLNWCFAFNKGEGVKCFRKALEFDPECVMALLGYRLRMRAFLQHDVARPQ